MLAKTLFAALLVAALFAGCSGTKSTPTPDLTAPAPGKAGYDYHGPGTLFAGPALYEDPQNTPHPAYNWPTLSHPAVGPNVPKYWAPIKANALPAVVTGMEHITDTPDVVQGAGIALFGSLAVIPSYSSNSTSTTPSPVPVKSSIPSAVVDISDPTHPKVLGTFWTQLGSHRGATIMAYPTGRLVTIISTGSGLDVWDITDPTHPAPLPPITIKSHKVGIVPGTPFVYNAASGGGGGAPESGNVEAVASGVTEMWDFSDPENVVRLPDFHNGYACHHIYFWNNVTMAKFRSICAGVQYTQIIDTKDPAHPTVITSVPFGTGGLGQDQVGAGQASFSHYAGLSLDGTLLLVGDEHGGGTGPIGCTAAADTPVGRVSPPIGAVWFYDVTDEHNPKLRGWVTASQLEKAGVKGAQASCTAHHGRLLPTPGRDILAMSFYGAGVVLVDFTALHAEGITFPKVLAQYSDNSDTWETWYYQGYLFTGDLNRGMDVLKIT